MATGQIPWLALQSAAQHNRRRLAPLCRCRPPFCKAAYCFGGRFVPCGQKGVRHARVTVCPVLPLCAGSASRCTGKARTCPQCHTTVCEERFALYRRDTHVSALTSHCVLGTLRAMLARHARVILSPPQCTGSASCYTGETRTCLPCPAPMCGKRFARETRTCLPCSAPVCGQRRAL